MKTYRYCYCESAHRTYRTLASRCLWPRAAWVRGEGAYALLAHCRALTVTLHKTYTDAIDALAAIDSHGCGGRCTGEHEVIYLAQHVGRRPRAII
jgi:hypothetical protein